MRIAGKLLLVLLSLLIVFHVLVILDVLPYDQTWGGSIEDKSQVIVFEGLAIVLTFVFILMVSIKLDYLKIKRLQKVADIAIWAMGGFFVISLIGNLLARGAMERIIFTPLSIVLVLLSFRLALSKRK